MKTLSAISALALVLAPSTTDAQLSHAPKRFRADHEDKGGGRSGLQSSQQQRQTTRGGERNRALDTQPITMPSEPADVEMSMPFDMVVEPTEPTEMATAEVPCATLNKKKCRKSVSCTWDKPVCYPTPAGAFLRRHGTSTRADPEPGPSPARSPSTPFPTDGPREPGRMPLEPAEMEMSMSFAMIATPAEPEIATLPGQEPTADATAAGDPCATLNKKKCRRDDSCTWDDPICHAAPAGNDALGNLIPAVDAQFATPAAPSTPFEPAATATEAPCAGLSKRKCAKNEGTCAWDETACRATPRIDPAAADPEPGPSPAGSPSTPFPTDGSTPSPTDGSTPFPTDGPREVVSPSTPFPTDGSREV